MVHVMKFYDYINQRGGKVLLSAIEGPPIEWASSLAIFEAAYKHEQKVTDLINNLVNISLAENDHATHTFLQWFVTEQVEEEASADEVVQKLKLIGNSGPNLFILDRELALRIFTPPATKQQA